MTNEQLTDFHTQTMHRVALDSLGRANAIIDDLLSSGDVEVIKTQLLAVSDYIKMAMNCFEIEHG